MIIHRCDVCGQESAWTESWSWWGSLGSEDHGHVLKFCSDNCKDMVDPEPLWKKKFGCSSKDRKYTR